MLTLDLLEAKIDHFISIMEGFRTKMDNQSDELKLLDIKIALLEMKIAKLQRCLFHAFTVSARGTSKGSLLHYCS